MRTPLIKILPDQAEEETKLVGTKIPLYSTGIMTAHEVIDQIKALPPEERAKVVGFVREMESAQSPPVRYADEKAFAEAAKWTFSEHAELMRKLSQ